MLYFLARLLILIKLLVLVRVSQVVGSSPVPILHFQYYTFRERTQLDSVRLVRSDAFFIDPDETFQILNQVRPGRRHHHHPEFYYRDM